MSLKSDKEGIPISSFLIFTPNLFETIIHLNECEYRVGSGNAYYCSMPINPVGDAKVIGKMIVEREQANQKNK